MLRKLRPLVLGVLATASLVGCSNELPEPVATTVPAPSIDTPQHRLLDNQYEIFITKCGENNDGHASAPFRAGSNIQNSAEFDVEGTIKNLSDLRRDYFFEIVVSDTQTGARLGVITAQNFGWAEAGEKVLWLGSESGHLNEANYIDNSSPLDIYEPGEATLSCSIGEMLYDTPLGYQG